MALVVITGGARSGKSGAAQRLAHERAREGRPVTLVVFGSESDAEMTERIGRHRADRPGGIVVVEATSAGDWLPRIAEGSLLVVDCLGTCLGLAMLEAWEATAEGSDMNDAHEMPAGFGARFAESCDLVVCALLARQGDTLIVTNEVGAGVVPAFATGRIFRDELGRANERLVRRADVAYLAIVGRLLDISGLPRDAAWPHD